MAHDEADARFETPEYWRTFYADDQFDSDELYDWYSSEEWLAENVVMQAESIAAARGVGREHVSVLDVGCGNSPLLFTLSETHSLRNLVGVDFCDKAIARCKEYSTANGFDPDDPSFKVMDATAMAEFADASFDVLCDKGCLDCFVNGDFGPNYIDRYWSEVARVLRPGGAYLVVPGNGCDIPHLLATGTIIKDVHSGSKVGAALVAEWEARKRIQRHAPYAPRLFLHAVRARDEKHLYVCRNAPPAQPVASLSCDMCDAAYAYPSGFPAQCGNCHNRLLRFALS